MKKQLSQSDASQLYNENALQLKLKFSRYHKYSFVFSGDNHRIKVEVMEGGNKDARIFRSKNICCANEELLQCNDSR
jgi:hypothetical protein